MKIIKYSLEKIKMCEINVIFLRMNITVWKSWNILKRNLNGDKIMKNSF